MTAILSRSTGWRIFVVWSIDAAEWTQFAVFPVTMNPSTQPVRDGLVLRVCPEHFQAYQKAHAAVWPEVLAQMARSHLRNYTIFHHDGLLFASYEYWGNDYEKDMASMATDPVTQEWREIMRPMQEPLSTRAPGEWWALMKPVFHFSGEDNAVSSRTVDGQE